MTRLRRPRPVLLTLLAVSLLPSALRAQGLAYIREHYTKYEYKVPMRDGVRLFTAVYVPKDAGPAKPYPILLTRTPYSIAPYGVDQDKDNLGPSDLFGRAGYIVAYQDVRGRLRSEGEFVHMRPIVTHEADSDSIDESTDARDTVDWLVKNIAGNNGKVGIWGISYPGFYAACATIDAHPALVAASPQAPVTDWFVGDDWHHNGAFMLPHAFNFLANFGRFRPSSINEPLIRFEHGTSDGYRFFLDLGPLANADARHFKGEVPFWNEIMAHGTYDDWWKARNVRPHLKGTKPAVLTVGGWFDAENHFGALETYKQIERSTPGARNRLVMGPWSHGGWARSDGASLGDVAFPMPTASQYRERVEFPFFEHHLKGAPLPEEPEAFVYETGRNQWRSFDAWPPGEVEPRSIYLAENDALSFEAPSMESEEALDEYISDPRRPVPFLEDIAIGMTPDYMIADQRFASRRPDVLVYQSPPLEEDLTIAGPIGVDFVVATTGTDADWIVKLIDVYPDTYPDNPAPEPGPGVRRVKMGGYQQLVRGDVMRGKFRESLVEPKAMTPGQPTRLRFTLHDACHTFRPGHRIMVQVQGTWFPLVDRNPQTFVDIYRAKDEDFQKATMRVYRSKSRASRLELPVIP